MLKNKLKNCINILKSFFHILPNIISCLRDLSIIFSFGFSIYYLFPILKSQMNSAKIESINIAGITVKLYDQLNIPSRIEGKEEIEVIPPIKTAAEYINYEGVFWVYLGATTPRGNKTNWVTKNFNISTVPQKGDIIEAISDVLKRAREPKIVRGKWTKGEIRGLVKRGQKVKVIEVVDIPGTKNRSLWWAKITSY
jgi:hypothetical protein